jgi:crossover junction endodeoxyribonuclease RusA
MTETRAATELDLPWPPSMNGYWIPRAVPGRGVFMQRTKRATVFRREVVFAVRKRMGRVALAPYSTPVRVDIELRVPDRRRRDIDNHVKAIFDALTHAGVWTDDSLVDELTVRRGRQLRHGMARVLIAALDVPPEAAEPTQPAIAFDEPDHPF